MKIHAALHCLSRQSKSHHALAHLERRTTAHRRHHTSTACKKLLDSTCRIKCLVRPCNLHTTTNKLHSAPVTGVLSDDAACCSCPPAVQLAHQVLSYRIFQQKSTSATWSVQRTMYRPHPFVFDTAQHPRSWPRTVLKKQSWLTTQVWEPQC
jgi:hypothetical protein